jgi:predicted DNA-binding antitoxin AbrB/MazE fold protein
MSFTVEAVYEDGVLKLNEALPFKEHEAVRVTVESALTSPASSSQRTADLARIFAHAGAVDLGKPTGADNESIDADLAREYGASHQDGR